MKEKKKRAALGMLAFVMVMLTVLRFALPAAAESLEAASAEPEEMSIDLDVAVPGCNSGSFCVEQPHTWIIRCRIPHEMGDGGSLVITDLLDRRLSYLRGSLNVMMTDEAGKEYPLDAQVHYSITKEGAMGEDGRGTALSVALTDSGMEYADGVENGRIQILFRAQINRETAMGESISNQAVLRFTDAQGSVQEVLSDIPEVHTGGIHLRKTDTGGHGLSGAEFRIARVAEEQELSDGTVIKDELVLEEEVLTVVYEDFFATKDLRGEKVSRVATDENGEAVFWGLAYGTYYIVETKPPEGYNLLTQPVAVIIDGASHLTQGDGWKDSEGKTVDNTVRLVSTKFILPDTGEMGTEVFTAAGIGIMAAAAMLIIMNRKMYPIV